MFLICEQTNRLYALCMADRGPVLGPCQGSGWVVLVLFRTRSSSFFCVSVYTSLVLFDGERQQGGDLCVAKSLVPKICRLNFAKQPVAFA